MPSRLALGGTLFSSRGGETLEYRQLLAVTTDVNPIGEAALVSIIETGLVSGVELTATAVSSTVAGPAAQQVVVADDGGLNASARVAWSDAVAQSSAVLSALPSRSDYSSVMSDVFGRAGTDPAAFATAVEQLGVQLQGAGLGITVEFLGNDAMQGALGAYAASGPDGSERIYINAGWLNRGATVDAVRDVLLHEVGHAIDRRLNGGIDSPGEEGELFADHAEGSPLAVGQLAAIAAADGLGTIAVNASTVAVEFATYTGTSGADTLTGSADADELYGLAGDDTLAGGTGNDFLSGGAGKDTLTGGTGTDNFYNPSGDMTISLGGSANSGTISGFDTITDFTLANGTVVSEGLRVNESGTATTVASKTGGTDGTNSSLQIGGNAISSHAISGGIITFDDTGSFASALSLASTANVAAVVDYLRRNDIGDAGATVAFTATISSAARTYVYTQPTASAPGSASTAFGLVELQGVTATGLTLTSTETKLGRLYLSDNLATPTLTTMSTLAGATEDTAFEITYATLSAASDATELEGEPLSFRIEAVSTGTLQKWNGTAWASVTAGTTTVGTGEKLQWTPAANANGTLNAFTVTASDGSAFSSPAVQVKVTASAVNDAPVVGDASVSILTTAVTGSLVYNVNTVGGNDTDVDGQQVRYSLSSDPSNGGFAINGTTGIISIADAAKLTAASYALQVTASDGTLSDTATITVSRNRYDVGYANIDISGLTLESGTAEAVNAVYKKANAITINGQVIDAKLTILGKSNVGTSGANFVVDDDTTYSEYAGSLQTNLNSTSTAGSYVEYRVAFYLGGTTTLANLTNFFVTVIDNDGISSSAVEYIELKDFSSYQLGPSTGITTSAGGLAGSTRFLGRTDTLNGIAFENTASLNAQYANAVSSVDFRAGITGSSPSARLFAVGFGASAGSFTNSLSVTDVTVNEGAGTATVTVSRAAASGAATVNYATSDGTAIAGTNYTARSGTLSFASGDTSKTFTVPITNDSVYQGANTFAVTLSNASSGSIITDGTATVTIRDDGTGSGGTDDDRPSFSISDVTVKESDGTATFTVVRTGTTAVSSTVSYATTASTATAGSDFTTTSGVLSFSAADASKTFSVPILNNSTWEATETFNVTLSGATNAKIGTASAVGTILDDDNQAPTATSSTITVLEDGSKAFAAADFGFSDADGNRLLNVIITALPTKGTLKLSGTDVTLNQVISAASLGSLVFAPAANANGAAYATFSFKVQDDGGTAGGGADTSVSANTITFNVTAVNDAPVATGSASLTAVNEDTASPSGATVSTLFASNFSDSTDTVTSGSIANTLLGVVVTANAATSGQGKWQWLNSSTWTDISTSLTSTTGLYLTAATSVRFLPAANWNGTPGSLTATLVDSSATGLTNGGTVNVSTNGGTTAYSSSSVTLGTSVTAVNDAPVAAANGVSGAVLSGSITELVGTAASSSARTASGTVVFSDVEFVDTLNVSLIGSNGYNWSGGTLTDAQKSALDAAISLSLGTATPSTTSIAQFVRTDWSFSAADSAFDFLAKNETLTITRTVEVSDGTATASATITVTVIGTNDVPVVTTTDAAQLGGTINDVSGSTTFGGATLSGTIAYADLDRKDTHVATVAVPAITWNDGTGVKTAAELETALGTAAYATIVNAAQSSSTFAVGTPATSNGTGSVGWTFTPAAAFKFLRTGQSLQLTYTIQIDDQNGGIATQNVVVVINGVSDAPAGTDATLAAHQNEPRLLTDSNFGFTDVDADNRASVIITTLPTAGTLQFKNGSGDWVGVTVNQDVSFDDIMAGRLRFVPVTGAAVASPYGSFTFQVRDDGSANPLQNTDQSPNTLTFNLLDFRGPNQTVPLEQEIDEDASLVFSGEKTISIAFVGEDGVINDVETIRMTLAVTEGVLTLGSTPAGLSITGNGSASIVLEGLRSNVNAAIDGLRFEPGANLNSIVTGGKHSFTTLTVTTVNVPAVGGFLYATDIDTVDIGVKPVNDAPVASGSATLASVDEDTANPPGASVATLFSGNFSDSTDQVVGGSSANTLAGIAIVGYTADTAKGVWQYSSDGTTWTTLAGVTGDAEAFTLTATDSLRFLPAAHYFGNPPSLACRLIESAGATVTTAATVDVSVNGGTTAISGATVVLSTSIISVNDLPVPTYGTNRTATEDGETITGQLTSTDVDNIDPPTYAVEGTAIPGLTINANGAFSFDPTNAAYQGLAVGETRVVTVTYRVTDDQGGYATRSFTITVTGIDDLQTGVSLTNSTVPENSAVGTVVGGLRTADADVTDTFSYTLVSGTGDTDNDKFEIVNGELKAKQSFDFENPVGASGNTYKIRVRSTADLAGRNPATLDSALTVTVLNLLEKLTIELVTDSRRDDVVAGDTITNVGLLALAGTGGESINATSGTADSRIEYSIDDGSTWSGSFRPIQGQNTLRVRQVDPAAVLAPSPASDAFTFTLDTIAVTLGVSLTEDTGSSSSDKVTKTGTLILSGVEAGAWVEYSVDNGLTWSDEFNAAEGLNSLRIRQVDIADNQSAVATFVFTYDTAAVQPVVELSSDTGSSSTDGKTRVGLVKVTGIETGARFSYSADGGNTWTSTFTPVIGENEVTVRQTDVSGNSSQSDPLTFWLDTSVVAPVVALVSDTGKSGTDKVTSNGDLAVTGTEPNALVQYSTNGGSTWSQSFTAVNGANSVRVRQTDTAGNMSTAAMITFTLDRTVSIPAAALTSDTGIFGDKITKVGTLAVSGVETGASVEYSADGVSGWSGTYTPIEGGNTAYVRQTDVAGNVSGNRVLTFTYDSTAPATPAVSLVSDTGVNTSDLVTKTGTLSLGGLEAGAKVEYQLNASTSWTTTFTPVQGVNTVKVRQTDVAGNGSQFGTLTFTFDSAVAAPAVVLTSDTGTSATDKITSVGTIAVTNVESGALVEYSPNGTTWSTSYSAVAGLNTVRVRQTDVAGNVSAVTTYLFTLDTSAPAAPTAALSSDTGTSATDRITRVGTLAPRGESGVKFEYSADGSTGWSSTFTPVEGPNSIYVRQRDVAGNVSTTTVAPFTFTLDTIAPTTAPSVALLNDTGIIGDLLTRDGRLSITGLDTGARAEYQLNAATTWLTTLTPVQGVNTVKVRQADVAGNGSPFTTLAFTLDSVAAKVTAVTLAETALSAVGSTVTFKVKFSEAVLISGTGTSNLSLALKFSSGATRSAVYQSGSGTDELVFSYVVVDADKAATITQATVTVPTGKTLQDGFGNTSAGSSLTLTLPSRIQL